MANAQQQGSFRRFRKGRRPNRRLPRRRRHRLSMGTDRTMATCPFRPAFRSIAEPGWHPRTCPARSVVMLREREDWWAGYGTTVPPRTVFCR
jgi:hypothetical protein